MKLNELIKEIEIIFLKGDKNIDITGISNDSRNIFPNFLFAARKGSKVDSNQHIAEAVSNGATCIITDEAGISEIQSITVVTVPDALRAYAIVSKAFFGNPSGDLRMIGITGTNGKTTTSFLINSILNAFNSASGLIGTIGYKYSKKTRVPSANTTPDPYDLNKMLSQMLLNGLNSCVMEVSSHSLVQNRVCDIDFDAAVFTNLTRDHLDYHNDMESYYQAKKLLFTDILSKSSKGKKYAVINKDDIYGERLIDEINKEINKIDKTGSSGGGKSGFKIITYGMSKDCGVFASNIKSDTFGMTFDLNLPSGLVKISSKLIGSYNVYNILAASAVSFALEVEPRQIAKGILDLAFVPGRIERVGVPNGKTPLIYIDYAHTDDALKRVLQVLKELTAGKLISVFGCGGDRDKGKRPLMGRHSGEIADITFITSDNPRNEEPLAIIKEIEAGMKETAVFLDFGNKNLNEFINSIMNVNEKHVYTIIPDRSLAIHAALSVSGGNDTVLIAGKGHEDYMIVGNKKFHYSDKEEVLKFYEIRV